MATSGATVRVGIIGFGGIARVAHVPGYQKAGAEIVAIATPNPSTAESAGRSLGAAWTTDYRELLGRADIDAVSVCTPTALHAEVAVAALRAGKHVFCEKPPALNAQQAELMAQTAVECRRILMYAFSARFRASSLRLHEWAEAGLLGEVHGGRAGWMRRRGNPAGWFTDRARAGGGALIDMGIHGLDLAWWLMGRPQPVAVSACTYRTFGNYAGSDAVTADPVMQIHLREKAKGVHDVEDSAFALLRFANGAHLFVEAAWALNCPREDRYVQLYGTKAGASLFPLRMFGDVQGVLADIQPEVAEADPFQQEVEHFVACVRGESQPLSPAADGVTVMRMVDAIYAASATGREATIA